MIYQINHYSKTIAREEENHYKTLFEDRELAMNALKTIADSDMQAYENDYLTYSYISLQTLLPNGRALVGELVIDQEEEFIGQIIDTEETFLHKGKETHAFRTF